MKLQRVFSTPGNGHYFSGYYDKSPLNGPATRILAQRAGFIDRLPDKGDRLEIGYCDFPNGQEFHPVAETSAWNWQQGCQLQWLGPGFDREFIFNDVRDGRFVSVICDLETGRQRVLPFPVYTVSSDGKSAMCIDYERHHWFRPAYNYMGVENPQKKQEIDFEDGIWRLSLDTGECRKVISLEGLKSFGRLQTMEDGPNYFEHLMFSPSGSRFCFLHRWRCGDGGILARLYTSDPEGKDVYLLHDSGRMSYFCWRHDDWMFGYGGRVNVFNTFRRYNWATKYVIRPLKPLYHFVFPNTTAMHRRVTGNGYWLFKDKTHVVSRFNSEHLADDGHPTFRPGDDNTFVTDTYPNRDNLYSVLVVDFRTGDLLASDTLRSLPNLKETGFRCDLHPKWSHDGRFVFVDTVNDGIRGIYGYELSS